MKILIYEQRVKKNISLRELSAMTGISKTTLNNHENEKHPQHWNN
ncbi:helix-turn-helix domain-containing protein [Amedibacillus sp. YH-ame10]